MAQPPVDRLSPIYGSPAGVPGLPLTLPPAGVIPWYPEANGQPSFWDSASAKNALPVLSNIVLQKMYNQFNESYGVGNWDNSDVQKAWEKGVEVTASLYSLYGQTPGYKGITPDVAVIASLPKLAAAGLKADGTPISGGAGGGGVSSSTSKSIRLTDTATARGLVDAALGNELGRAATPKEQQMFYKALNVQEQRNPTITNQTTVSGGSSSLSTSKTTGGFNPSVFASEYAAGQEGAGEYQAATSLLDTFIGALGAKV